MAVRAADLGIDAGVMDGVDFEHLSAAEEAGSSRTTQIDRPLMRSRSPFRLSLASAGPISLAAWRTLAECLVSSAVDPSEVRDSFRRKVYDCAVRVDRYLYHDNSLAIRVPIEPASQQRYYLRLERGVGAI